MSTNTDYIDELLASGPAIERTAAHAARWSRSSGGGGTVSNRRRVSVSVGVGVGLRQGALPSGRSQRSERSAGGRRTGADGG